ncbi:DUF4254 domain-containing protein [bacterium]|nr:DUF4254 domain-containing protein [bacterium]MCG2677536.1 DUF4254 domain-containing protein [bacterium]
MAETIGSLIDKISIFEQKCFHMGEETERRDVSQEHIKECKKRLLILKRQRDDLVEELDKLFQDVLKGKKKLKVYKQFKMYNLSKYRREKSY